MRDFRCLFGLVCWSPLKISTFHRQSARCGITKGNTFKICFAGNTKPVVGLQLFFYSDLTLDQPVWDCFVSKGCTNSQAIFQRTTLSIFSRFRRLSCAQDVFWTYSQRPLTFVSRSGMPRSHFTGFNSNQRGRWYSFLVLWTHPKQLRVKNRVFNASHGKIPRLA